MDKKRLIEKLRKEKRDLKEYVSGTYEDGRATGFNEGIERSVAIIKEITEDG